jgi:hypothetical protein
MLLVGDADLAIIRKIRRGLTSLLLAPFLGFEKKECDRRLKERIKRAENKSCRKR